MNKDIKEIERYLTDTDSWGKPVCLFKDTACYHIRDKVSPTVCIDIHKIYKDSVEIDITVGIKHLVDKGFLTYRFDSPIGKTIRDKIKRDSKGIKLITYEEQMIKDYGEDYLEDFNSYGEW